MRAEIDQFVDFWCYDIERILQRKLDSLKNQLLDSDDDETHRDIAQLLDWLLGRREVQSPAQRLEDCAAELRNTGFTDAQKLRMAKFAARATGNEVGRPRTRNRDAIRALELHLKTDMSWREIALQVCGCNHVCKHCGRPATTRLEGRRDRRSKRQNCPKCGLMIRSGQDERKRSCSACGDALRDAVGSLTDFMRRHKCYPTMPRRTELVHHSDGEENPALTPGENTNRVFLTF